MREDQVALMWDHPSKTFGMHFISYQHPFDMDNVMTFVKHYDIISNAEVECLNDLYFVLEGPQLVLFI